MKAQAYLNGIFPRSDLALESGSRWLKGRETKENFERLLEKETNEVIELQQSLGFDYVIDGLLFWDDLLRPIANALGLSGHGKSSDENQVTRQIYTNTFYRKPVISGRIKKPGKEIMDTRFFGRIQTGKRKAILPSPFSIAYLSDGVHRDGNGEINKKAFVEVLLDLAKILNEQAKALEEKSHVSFIQFNEPCIAYAKETMLFWDAINDSLNEAANGIRAVTSLHLYNGDASKFLPELSGLCVDRIGIDAYSTNMRNFIGKPFDKFLEIGVINSKNSLIEYPEMIAKYAHEIMEGIRPKGLAIVPNRPLELVPRQIAIKKIESMAKAAELLRD